MSRFLAALVSLSIFALSAPVNAGFSLDTWAGDRLDIQVTGDANRGPLFLWLLNQYGETQRYDALAAGLARLGASVWRVDLLESLMLQRTAEAIRGIDGVPVASLVAAAVESCRRPIVLVASDRMAVPLLRGLREWQVRLRAQGARSDAVAGAVLFFPNLYKAAPVAGEEPELMEIVAATTLPMLIMQPALGVNRHRLPDLLETLESAGGHAFAWLVKDVRDYYLFQTERPVSESLQAMAGKVPAQVDTAIRETPARLITAARLLAASPQPEGPKPLKEDPRGSSPLAYGLVERPPIPAPGLRLMDLQGQPRGLNKGPLSLVSFWASWCPPCVQEIPSMNRLAAAYDPDDFGIVSINYREDPAQVRAFLQRVQVDFPVLLDVDGAVSAFWRVFAFPSSFLLDRRGRVRYSVNTAIEWDTQEVKAVIDALLKEDTGDK